MRGRGALLLAALGAQACILAPRPFVTPSPGDEPALEAQLEADPTDLFATVSLATLRLSEDRVSEAQALLADAVARAPADPVTPLLLAVARERSGEIRTARAGYDRYSRTHYGVLAHRAAERIVATAPEALRRDVADLVASSPDDRSVTDLSRVAVVPFARAVGGEIDAEAVAVAALLTGELAGAGFDVVEPARVRAALTAMSLSGAERSEVATGIELGRLLGAGRVIQGVGRRVSLEEVDWNVTLTTLDSTTQARIDVINVGEAAAEPALLLWQLISEVRAALRVEGPRGVDPMDVPTLSPDALVAYGAGLLAMDRSDWVAAQASFSDALMLDAGFDAAIAMWTVADVATSTPSLDSLVAETVRVGTLRRSILALGGVGDGGTTAPSVSDRSMISDLLGLDAVTGGVPLDVTLTLPGGSR